MTAASVGSGVGRSEVTVQRAGMGSLVVMAAWVGSAAAVGVWDAAGATVAMVDFGLQAANASAAARTINNNVFFILDLDLSSSPDGPGACEFSKGEAAGCLCFPGLHAIPAASFFQVYIRF